jgi:hypothetical protein
MHIADSVSIIAIATILLSAGSASNLARDTHDGHTLGSEGLRDRLRRIRTSKATRDGRVTIFLRPPSETEFTDDALGPGPGFWRAHGAVMVGFRDPALGPNLPSVPEDDPHRTSPPRWLAEDTQQSEDA